MRSMSVVLTVVLVLLTTGCRPAPPPKAEAAAKAAAAAWVRLLDDDQYGESWDQAAGFCRELVPRDQWEQRLRAARKPMGKLLSRKLKSARFVTQLPGAPDGEYVVIQYKCSFANKKKAVETVTPMKDADGLWRVSGYYIR